MTLNQHYYRHRSEGYVSTTHFPESFDDSPSWEEVVALPLAALGDYDKLLADLTAAARHALGDRSRRLIRLRDVLAAARPEPEPLAEPGIGALVEVQGEEWVHLNCPRAPWQCGTRWATWDDLLSFGTPRVVIAGLEDGGDSDD